MFASTLFHSCYSILCKLLRLPVSSCSANSLSASPHHLRRPSIATSIAMAEATAYAPTPVPTAIPEPAAPQQHQQHQQQPPTPPVLIPLSATEVFDSVGAAYEDAFANCTSQASAVVWLAAQLAARPAGAPRARVVDIGCGTGRPACSVLADAGHDVLGIDISPAMLAAARARVPNARFELADVRQFLAQQAADASSAKFDAITIFFSLIAGVTQAEIRAIIAGLAGLLAPGGLLVWSTVPIPVESETIRWMGRPVTVSSLAPADAVAAVQTAGLRIVHQGLTQFKPRSAEVGLCKPEEAWEETHLFVYAKKEEA